MDTCNAEFRARRSHESVMKIARTPRRRDGMRCVIAACIAAWMTPAAVAAESVATPRVEIVFAGDTSFGESYQDRLASEGREPVLRTRGYDYMSDAVEQLLDGASLVIVNLETPITDHFPSPFAGEKTYLHYADPVKTPKALVELGVDIVSLANNHTLDYGLQGLEQTEAVLAERGMSPCGASTEPRAALEPVVRELEIGARSMKLALICAFEWRDSYEE